MDAMGAMLAAWSVAAGLSPKPQRRRATFIHWWTHNRNSRKAHPPARPPHQPHPPHPSRQPHPSRPPHQPHQPHQPTPQPRQPQPPWSASTVWNARNGAGLPPR